MSTTQTLQVASPSPTGSVQLRPASFVVSYPYEQRPPLRQRGLVPAYFLGWVLTQEEMKEKYPDVCQIGESVMDQFSDGMYHELWRKNNPEHSGFVSMLPYSRVIEGKKGPKYLIYIATNEVSTRKWNPDSSFIQATKTFLGLADEPRWYAI